MLHRWQRPVLEGISLPGRSGCLFQTRSPEPLGRAQLGGSGQVRDKDNLEVYGCEVWKSVMTQHPRTGGSEAVSAFPWFPVPESLLTRSCGPQRPTEWVQEAQNTDPQALGVGWGRHGSSRPLHRRIQRHFGARGTLGDVRLLGHFPLVRRWL